MKLTLSQAPERTGTILLGKTDQDGASAADYSGVPASVSFAATERGKTFTFEATQDSEDDDGENVKLGFGTLPTGVSDGTNTEATVNVTDDDAPQVTVSFESATYTVAEGGSETVRVKLSQDPEHAVMISITKADQNGATRSDYSGVPENVTFNSGDTGMTFTLKATLDTDNDDGENVKLTFGTLPASISEGTIKETVVSITDDDLPGSVTVSFEQSSFTVAEGSSETVKVKLDTDPERSVTILLTKTPQDGASNAD